MLTSLHYGHPWLLLAALPAFLLWWRWRRRMLGSWVALASLLLLVLAMSDPQMHWGSQGRDVVLIFDRSRSMGSAVEAQAEMLHLVASSRRSGDRLAVISLAQDAHLIQALQSSGQPLELEAVDMDPDSTDLAAALKLARSLIPPHRHARVLLHSDGEFTGADPLPAAADLALSGIAVDCIPHQRHGSDPAIQGIELPSELRLGMRFIGSLRLVGDRFEQRSWELWREGQRIAAGRAQLRPGEESIVHFIDRPTQAGIVRYQALLDSTDDARPGNNRAEAALRVRGGEEVLLISGDGEPGNLAALLQAAGMRLRLRAEGPIALADLDGIQALVLDNVPAGVLGKSGQEAIAAWVRHQGGGLLVLGGRRSFAGGGYAETALEDILPVSSMPRDERHRLSLSLAVTMDRSGSMNMPVADGRTKMQLANEGVIAALQLLSPQDSVAVHAVDTEVHVIVPMTSLSERQRIIEAVRGIRSMGGGIYVYKALVAAGQEVLSRDAGTRHILLFTDAADTERPDDYRNLLQRFSDAGITVSVIALGRPSDVDAELCRDIARRGNGRIVFTERAEEMPELFAHETMLVARLSWVNEETVLRPEPSLDEFIGPGHGLSDWPVVAGYNQVYTKPDAQNLVWAEGDPEVPALAAWRVGSGRVVSLALALDDPRDASLRQWPETSRLLASLLRWSANPQPGQGAELTVQRDRQSLRLDLYLDPQQQELWPSAPYAQLLGPGVGMASPQKLELQPQAAGHWRAYTSLRKPGLVLPSVLLDGVQPEVLPGPVVQLPYSPEDAPREQPGEGLMTLELISQVGGGRLRQDVAGLFAGPASPGQRRSLAAFLLAAAIIAAVYEMSRRHMRWSWPSFGQVKPEQAALAGSDTYPLASTAQAQPAKPDTQATPLAAPASESQSAGSGGIEAALRQARRRRP